MTDFKKSTFDGRNSLYFDSEFNFIHPEIFCNVMNGKFVKIDKDLIYETSDNVVTKNKFYYTQKYQSEIERINIIHLEQKMSSFHGKKQIVYMGYENENKEMDQMGVLKEDNASQESVKEEGADGKDLNIDQNKVREENGNNPKI